MKTIILAGGLGTRLTEETEARPKPMVEIGGKPILWHIMKIYAAHGFNEFVVTLGYKGEAIKDFFVNYHYRASSLTVDISDGSMSRHDGNSENWRVHLIDTGLATQTGGRIKRAASLLGSATFMLTYGDGVADIDLLKLLAFHRSHGKLATITAVRPPARFGGLRFDGDHITEFTEKPQIGEGWINGGFFVFEPQVLDYIAGDETLLEREPLERLAREGQLVAHKHDGFWQCMDTVRDLKLLENLWKEGRAPWKIWE
ncbi:MAG: glucose-1-phosphate cytidylyltransferase [bacterium]